MKNFILISFLILLSCGSRTSQKEKSVERLSESLKQTEKAEKSNEVNSIEQTQAKEEKAEISKEKQSKNESLNKNTEANSAKTNSENNSKTTKKTTYFPNGQKKSETETNENYSKLSDEKDYYKANSESLKEKLNESEKVQNSIYQQNLKLVSNNKELININKNSISELLTVKTELKKATERKFYPFWLWIAVGFFLKILVGAFWKWFKTTSLFAKLPIINFKNK